MAVHPTRVEQNRLRCGTMAVPPTCLFYARFDQSGGTGEGFRAGSKLRRPKGVNGRKIHEFGLASRTPAGHSEPWQLGCPTGGALGCTSPACRSAALALASPWSSATWQMKKSSHTLLSSATAAAAQSSTCQRRQKLRIVM
jgi:hypothetical protein